MDKVFLKKLTAAWAPSGREDEVRAFLAKEAEKICDDVTTDVLGNLIVHRKGAGKKILLCSHMDTNGLVLLEFDEKGYGRVGKVGKMDAAAFVGRTIVFKNGEKAVLACGDSLEKAPEYEDLYADFGVQGRDNARKKADIADMAVPCPEVSILGSRLAGFGASDRIGCAVILEALRHDKSDADLYVVFSAQEKVGSRGAGAVSWAVDPDYAINVHAATAGDAPGCKRACLKLGAGPSIEVMDKTAIVPPVMRDKLKAAAEGADLPYQLDALCYDISDAASLQRAGKGVYTGAVAVPARYIGTGAEMVDLTDAENAVRLLNAFIKENA